MTFESEPTPPASGDGGSPAASTCVPCAAAAAAAATPVCPTDFTIDAPCRILNVNSANVQITARDLAGFSGGSFAWTTGSAKISLQNANSATCTVQARTTPSASRAAEIITVTRSQAGCTDVVKTVAVSVAKVTFSASASQRYGHDNFDTPADPLDDHVCIKKQDHTFLAVNIEGGAVGTDFDFVCDDPTVCKAVAPPGSASFDLRLDAGDEKKKETTLHAKVKCPAAASFASIKVNVYKEVKVEVVVAKIYDRAVAATNLRFPNADYAAHTGSVNGKVKEAVVKYDITNYDPGNARKDIRYDLDGDGTLSFDIKNDGGAELDAIKSAMTGTGTKIRVAIVRDMESYYYLKDEAKRGDRTVTVTAAAAKMFFSAGDASALGRGASLENVTVDSAAGSTVTLRSPLANNHAPGEPMTFPAGGWSSDPILIKEGAISEQQVKWSVAHEAGHRALDLRDVKDKTNLMNEYQDWTDYRLRYCPRQLAYSAATENQWEEIPRT
jgi:hypothetical protein